MLFRVDFGVNNWFSCMFWLLISTSSVCFVEDIESKCWKCALLIVWIISSLFLLRCLSLLKFLEFYHKVVILNRAWPKFMYICVIFWFSASVTSAVCDLLPEVNNAQLYFLKIIFQSLCVFMLNVLIHQPSKIVGACLWYHCLIALNKYS